jgi:hypothetical protein
MNHTITFGGLLLGIGILGGLLAFCGGVLSVFAEGMSDAPSEDNGKSGCITAIVGLVLLVGCIVGLLV